MNRRDKNSFNVFDLGVVLLVLGVAVGLAVPSYQALAAHAKYVGTKSLLVGIQTVIVGRREVDHQTLMVLTQSGCTFCDQGLTPGVPLTGARPSWTPAIAAQWAVMGYGAQPLDAWNRPLIADENELEFGPADCRHDALYSAGEDGVFEGGAYDNASTGARGDDILVSIPWFKQTADHCPTDVARANF